MRLLRTVVPDAVTNDEVDSSKVLVVGDARVSDVVYHVGDGGVLEFLELVLIYHVLIKKLII